MFVKKIAEQALSTLAQNVAYKLFMCTVYNTFHDECLKKISSITFIS